jgi:hypothetical protein
MDGDTPNSPSLRSSNTMAMDEAASNEDMSVFEYLRFILTELVLFAIDLLGKVLCRLTLSCSCLPAASLTIF